MAKAGEAAKARTERKANIKQKKKFSNKNSIGKTRRNVGSEARYVTRTGAVKKLQVTLKDFRRLCILKGIYPREPRKKFKGGNTTYYFAKDIAFLAHEPLLEKFREQKAFLKKIRRAVGRYEKKEAKRLDARRPVYKLDHLIRERFPTFVDALRDLDDALSMVHLFAQVASSKLVPPTRVQACARLANEFQAYVARTRSLRKVFVSIKGFYYQAEVQGVTLTWVVPHDFAQQTSASVDYRVMLSFLELHEALLTLVNFKLFHMLALKYPPDIDTTNESKGGRISAIVLEGAPTVSAAAAKPRAEPARPAAAGGAKPPTAAQLKSLRRKLEAVERDGAAAAEADADGADGASPAAAEEEEGAGDEAAVLSASLPPDLLALRSLFSSCVFYCGRECPISSLEFVVLSCGGTIGWDGEASRLSAEDERITHRVVDRPMSPDQLTPATREFVQPQWVYDCINARALLPTHPYRPGAHCPPHLSPFRDGDEGYTPLERVRAVLAGGEAGDGVAEEEDVGAAGGEDESEGSGEEDGGESDEEDGGESGEEEEEEEAAEYARELRAEVQGVPYSQAAVAQRGKARQPAASSPAVARAAKREAEEKELAKMMMTRKKRRLYDRMQYGIEKKAAAAEVLAAKRVALTPAKAAKSKRLRKEA